MDGATDICSDNNLSDLKYLDDVVTLSGNRSKLQVFLYHLNDNAGMCWVCILYFRSANAVAELDWLEAEPFSRRGTTDLVTRVVATHLVAFSRMKETRLFLVIRGICGVGMTSGY